MKQAYLLVYDDEVGTRKEIREFLDKQPEILHGAVIFLTRST